MYLGNMSIREMEERCKITLTDSERKTLEGLREEIISNVKGNNKIHIYDIPFLIECGNAEARKTVLDILMPYSGQIKARLGVGGGVE